MNTRRSTCMALLAGAASLAGCAGVTPTHYAQQKPKLELDQYFNGRVLAHGLFQNRSGEVVKRFTVEMDCSWQGNQGVLDETFLYSDGSREKRIWRITKLPDGRYVGRADDVVGEAQGEASGNALRWQYTLRLPVDGKTYDVQFDDWMYLIDEKVMINRATMSKFGFRLGEVLLSFTRT